MRILVLNAGSSSVKAVLSDIPEPLPSRPPGPLWSGTIEWGRTPGTADLRVRTFAGETRDRKIPFDSLRVALDNLLQSLFEGTSLVAPGSVDAVGHRVVHGGKALRETTRITADVKAEIARLAEFAPEHNPLTVEAIEAAERAFGPATPQFAVFDTAFHSTLPRAAAVYPGPYAWLDLGIERFGFHGISHRYTSRRAAEILGADLNALRIITCHLGNGCSLAAVREGRSIDTTMGFTPLEGLMMGTRSGSVDPGIIIYLVRHFGYGAQELDAILNEQSGLKGLSGRSGDLREVLRAMEEGDPRAKLAFEVYTHRLCREIGGMLASLGGMDALVFTAGVGENCSSLREAVCRQFQFLGLKIDPTKNARSPVDEEISSTDSSVRVLVIHTEEDWEIMRECHFQMRPRA